MSAGVHHGNVAGGLLHAHLARVWEARVLFDRQGIKLRAQHDRCARAVLHHADNSSSAHARSDLIAELAKIVSELGGRARLVRRQLWVAMQVDVCGLKLRVD